MNEEGSGERGGDATQPVSRRRVLQVLGMAPLIAATGVVGAQPPHGSPQAPRQPHETPNQPAAGAARPANAAPQRRFFTAREWSTVLVLADDIIPRDERSGSATDAGVPAFMDYHMSVPETSDDARTQMRGGLRWLDTESRRRFGVAYHQAREPQRHQLLDDIAVTPAQAKPEHRAGAGFFASFRNLVASGMGWKDLQYQGSVFNPDWQGCPQPALDKLGVHYGLMTTRVAPQSAGSQ